MQKTSKSKYLREGYWFDQVYHNNIVSKTRDLETIIDYTPLKILHFCSHSKQHLDAVHVRLSEVATDLTI